MGLELTTFWHESYRSIHSSTSRYLLTKYKTLQLQEFSSAVVCAELRAAQCVFDRRSSSYCLMLDPSSVCSCSDYWMCEWSVHGPGKIPKTDRKKRKTAQSAFFKVFFPLLFLWREGWDSASFLASKIHIQCSYHNSSTYKFRHQKDQVKIKIRFIILVSCLYYHEYRIKIYKIPNGWPAYWSKMKQLSKIKRSQTNIHNTSV